MRQAVPLSATVGGLGGLQQLDPPVSADPRHHGPLVCTICVAFANVVKAKLATLQQTCVLK
jgi:hypothetical protein